MCHYFQTGLKNIEETKETLLEVLFSSAPTSIVSSNIYTESMVYGPKRALTIAGLE